MSAVLVTVGQSLQKQYRQHTEHVKHNFTFVTYTIQQLCRWQRRNADKQQVLLKALLAEWVTRINPQQNIVTSSDGSQMVIGTNWVACKPRQRRCPKLVLTAMTCDYLTALLYSVRSVCVAWVESCMLCLLHSVHALSFKTYIKATVSWLFEFCGLQITCKM